MSTPPAPPVPLLASSACDDEMRMWMCGMWVDIVSALSRSLSSSLCLLGLGLHTRVSGLSRAVGVGAWVRGCDASGLAAVHMCRTCTPHDEYTWYKRVPEYERRFILQMTLPLIIYI